MLSAPQFELAAPMPANEEQFFKALGAKIAELRKEQSLSQQALADQLIDNVEAFVRGAPRNVVVP